MTELTDNYETQLSQVSAEIDRVYEIGRTIRGQIDEKTALREAAIGQEEREALTRQIHEREDQLGRTSTLSARLQSRHARLETAWPIFDQQPATPDTTRLHIGEVALVAPEESIVTPPTELQTESDILARSQIQPQPEPVRQDHA
jgi:hypothetical protein